MRFSRLLLIPLIGCTLPEPAPPSAEFLVADASSTYWVHSTPRGITARVSPLILTRADDRFYEVWVDEVTRSYENAVFTGEPIYRRDLLTGDSTLVAEDGRVFAWEKLYLERNPNARLLSPDEDTDDDVGFAASGEVDILGVAGPYVLYDRRLLVERSDYQQADSSRGAVDIRSGKAVPLSKLARDSAALSAGSVREGAGTRWRHSGYDVVAEYDTARAETEVVLRDQSGHKWVLGYVDSRLPRVFWLDEPAVDPKLRVALAAAFDDARSEDDGTQLVMRRGKRVPPGASPRLVRAQRYPLSAARQSVRVPPQRLRGARQSARAERLLLASMQR